MGLFSSVVHSIQHVVDQVAKPATNLFNGDTALARALVNPADPVAVGQTLYNTAVKGQTPERQLSNADATQRQLVGKVGEYHQDLWDAITDGLHWVGHEISAAKRSVYRFVRVKGNKLGDNIHLVVEKWGGERRIVGWIVFGIGVIIFILVEFFSWGSATPAATAGLLALASLCVSYGASQGLTPDPPKAKPLALFSRVDEGDSTYNNNSITTEGGSSSGGAQSGSVLQQLLDGLGLGGLPTVAVVGVAAAGVAGLYFLLRR